MPWRCMCQNTAFQLHPSQLPESEPYMTKRHATIKARCKRSGLLWLSSYSSYWLQEPHQGYMQIQAPAPRGGATPTKVGAQPQTPYKVSPSTHSHQYAKLPPMTLSRPQVLRLGEVSFAHQKWDELAQVADVIECTSASREEFFADLKTKYANIVSITRTVKSVEQTGRFDEELALHLPSSVRTLSHCGAGYDQIDVAPFTARNIQVSNVTEPVEGPTATTAVYLTLSALRNYQDGHNRLMAGKWVPTTKAAGVAFGREPEGCVVGILGLGGIGRAIRDRLVPFGFKKLIYHNRTRLSEDLEKGTQYVSYDELLAQSDVILVSVPLNPKTWHLLDKKAFAKMKDGVVIVNTSRGAVLNESDVYEALKSGKIGSFAADVFEFEPKVEQHLVDLPNVVSLPHMGTHSVEGVRNQEIWVVQNVWDFLHSGKVKTIVPEQASVDFGHEAVVAK